MNNNNNNNNNNKGKGRSMFIDIGISGDRNVIKKVAQKVLIYEYFSIQIQYMNNAKTEVIAVKIGATGIILQSFSKYLKTGKHQIEELQDTAILCTAHILRKALM
jgi:hypothetical protein